MFQRSLLCRVVSLKSTAKPRVPCAARARQVHPSAAKIAKISLMWQTMEKFFRKFTMFATQTVDIHCHFASISSSDWRYCDKSLRTAASWSSHITAVSMAQAVLAKHRRVKSYEYFLFDCSPSFEAHSRLFLLADLSGLLSTMVRLSSRDTASLMMKPV